MLADLELARAIAASEAVDEKARAAFADMAERLQSGRLAQLSHAQRQWADALCDRHELDADLGSQNLASRGLVPRGKPEPEYRHLWTDARMTRPLKPPQVLARELKEKK